MTVNPLGEGDRWNFLRARLLEFKCNSYLTWEGGGFYSLGKIKTRQPEFLFGETRFQKPFADKT